LTTLDVYNGGPTLEYKNGYLNLSYQCFGWQAGINFSLVRKVKERGEVRRN
jgi:hypothetical protein